MYLCNTKRPWQTKSSVLLQTLWKCKTREVSRLTTTKTNVSWLFSEATEGWSSTRMQRKMQQQQQLHCLSGKQQQVLCNQLWKPLSEYKHNSEIQSGSTPHFFIWAVWKNSSSPTPISTLWVYKTELIPLQSRSSLLYRKKQLTLH